MFLADYLKFAVKSLKLRPATHKFSAEMTQSLPDLPVEVVEAVVCNLVLDDIRNLRHVSAVLAAKASQGSFKMYFRTKHVDLTKQSLENFVEITKQGSLGSIVEDVVLVGIVNNTKGLENVLSKKTKTKTEDRGPMFSSPELPCSPEELVNAEADRQTLETRRVETEEL